jgi:hypothetical protein
MESLEKSPDKGSAGALPHICNTQSQDSCRTLYCSNHLDLLQYYSHCHLGTRFRASFRFVVSAYGPPSLLCCHVTSGGHTSNLSSTTVSAASSACSILDRMVLKVLSERVHPELVVSVQAAYSAAPAPEPRATAAPLFAMLVASRPLCAWLEVSLSHEISLACEPPAHQAFFYLRLDVLHGFVGMTNVGEQVIPQLGWTGSVFGDLRGEPTGRVVQFPVNSGVGLVFVI